MKSGQLVSKNERSDQPGELCRVGSAPLPSPRLLLLSALPHACLYHPAQSQRLVQLWGPMEVTVLMGP